MDRRQLLKFALVAASTQVLSAVTTAQTKFDRNPFALGVASGSPRHDGVVLWTRLLFSQPTGNVIVRWELAEDEGFRRILRTGESLASPVLAHSIHVELAGLKADRWYFYRFMLGDALSAVGRTRTFAAPGAAASRLRLAYASCQRFEHGYYAAYRHMREESLDAVLFLGDYIYEYAPPKDAVRRHSLGRVRTLDDYRRRYALYRGDADLQAMHACCPWLVTWDDHEVQNNYAGLRGEEGEADFAARRASAYQAYYEHMPLPAACLTRAIGGLADGAELRIYDRFVFGDLATIHMLDARQYREPQACVRGGVVTPAECAELSDGRRSILGAEQERWLAGSLSGGNGASASRWNIVGQQTLFSRRDYFSGEDAAYSVDGWDGYPTARQRLLNVLRQTRTNNTVFLGGDIHANWVGHVRADFDRPASGTVGVEFCGTSISSRGGSNARIPELLRENPHFVFADAERRGYGVAEFTPQQVTTTLRVVDDVTRQDSGIQTLASFSVQQGSAVIERNS